VIFAFLALLANNSPTLVAASTFPPFSSFNSLSIEEALTNVLSQLSSMI
jgi:hypothetical protein